MNAVYNNKYDILASTIQPNPASVKYWADLSSNPNGGDLKYFNGKTWVLVNNKATEDITDIKSDITKLQESKVDKVPGKQLSTEDYTSADKSKLASLSNYDDKDVRNLISALATRVGNLETNYSLLEARVAELESPAA